MVCFSMLRNRKIGTSFHGQCVGAAVCLIVLNLAACENTDLGLAAEAGLEAVKAATISDAEVQSLAADTAKSSDVKNRIAAPEDKYAVRLRKLTGGLHQDGNRKFNYAVYLSPEVNAFAMADGSIRVYSGLMDKMTDGELAFVIGHEMGHVQRNHIGKKIRLALAASAVRKGVASQIGTAGDIAGSAVGGLAQVLINAQFSQLEEKEADDYALLFMKRESMEPRDAVSALRKLAGLGGIQSFLSSHPDPALRADRLQARLEGRPNSDEAKTPDSVAEGIDQVKDYLTGLYEKLIGLIQ
jgi:putative metalloprotease